MSNRTGSNTHRQVAILLALVVAGHGAGAQSTRLTTIRGGGPVIQVLPGPDAMADSAAPVIAKAPPEKQQMLKMMAMNGPFSDNVATIDGKFSGTFWDGGAKGDSVSAIATFKTEDGASWRVVIDRVAPEDEGPMDPHWGGVGTDVTYHGTTGLGLPLVPIVRSQVSYYGMAHLYRDGQLIEENAAIHVMLTSQTRGKARGHAFAYTCWNCTKNPVEQLHLMLMPAMGKMYPVPGGIIHVMWQKSQGKTSNAR
ncbi:MAG: hypothetical protein ABI877_13935 [Gemmatimonadaceae bacterium]